MPCDEPEPNSGCSKRRRRSRSRKMTPSPEVIDLTKSLELEASSSRKHNRQEGDSQAEGPNKRAKLHRKSEPPMRKDTTTTPRREQKKTKKKINHRKARTGTYHELKKSNDTLEGKLWDAEQARKKAEQALEDKKQQLRLSATLLKRVRKSCDEKSEEVQKQHLTIETDREELRLLRDSCQRKDGELKAKDAVIAAMQQELDEARKDCEKALQEGDAARIINASNGSFNERIIKREKTAKEKLKKERKECNESILAFKTEISDLQEQRADLETSLQTRQNQFNQAITRLQLKLRDSRPQSKRFNFKVPDESIRQDFVNLQFKIQRFGHKYARPVLNVTEQELQSVWPSWSPELRRFLASPLLCNRVFEGYIWERLLARVFTPWSEVWTGELGQSLEKALCIAGEEVEAVDFGSELYVDYQYWRSSSSNFISRLNGEDFRPKYFESDVKAMISTVAELCGDDANDAMKADAMDIFKDARNFEIQLRMLKAVYSFHMCKPVPSREKFTYGFYFDDEGMTDLSPSPVDKDQGEAPVVDFIMSPGLCKRGSNDGDMYENDMWLVKMGVVCNAARILQKSGSSITTQPVPVQTPNTLCSGEVEQKDAGPDTASQCHGGFKPNGIKIEKPTSGSTHIKVEDTDSYHDPGSLSAPGLTFGLPSHNATQMQPTPATNVMTRSQASLKAESNFHDGKSSTKSTTKHLHPQEA